MCTACKSPLGSHFQRGTELPFNSLSLSLSLCFVPLEIESRLQSASPWGYSRSSAFSLCKIWLNHHQPLLPQICLETQVLQGSGFSYSVQKCCVISCLVLHSIMLLLSCECMHAHLLLHSRQASWNQFTLFLFKFCKENDFRWSWCIICFKENPDPWCTCCIILLWKENPDPWHTCCTIFCFKENLDLWYTCGLICFKENPELWMNYLLTHFDLKKIWKWNKFLFTSMEIHPQKVQGMSKQM